MRFTSANKIKKNLEVFPQGLPKNYKQSLTVFFRSRYQWHYYLIISLWLSVNWTSHLSHLLCRCHTAEKETGGRLAPSTQERKATSQVIMWLLLTPSRLKSKTLLLLLIISLLQLWQLHQEALTSYCTKHTIRTLTAFKKLYDVIVTFKRRECIKCVPAFLFFVFLTIQVLSHVWAFYSNALSLQVVLW